VVEKTEKGKFVKTYPIQSGEGIVIDDAKEVEMNGEIVLSGHDAFHDDVLVRTSKKEIEECMNEIDTDVKAKHCFRESWNRIKKVNTDILYAEGGENWKNFLDDIVIYYCARFRLFGKPMPAVFSPEVKDMCVRIGNADAKADFSKNTVVHHKATQTT